MTQTFGEALKETRKVRGITIVEVAEKKGLSQADLVRVELGLKELTSGKRQRIEAFIRRQRIIKYLFPPTVSLEMCTELLL